MRTAKSFLNGMKQMLSLLEDPGTPCSYGCNQADLFRIADQVRNLFPDRPVRFLKGWQWLDISFSDSDTAKIKKQGFYPVKLKADSVTYDETGRYTAEHWIITSLMCSFDGSCICETKDAICILTGPGARKTVTPEALEALAH